MITRLWFVVSVLWFAVVCFLVHWSEMNALSIRATLWFAVTPFLIGLVVRIAYRYVRFGPRLR